MPHSARLAPSSSYSLSAVELNLRRSFFGSTEINMASSSMSPGAALLRSSRMFSMPNPLPPPKQEARNTHDVASPTMTKAYPQHQAVATLQSARAAGDWGFKRPLPLKTTMSGRYNAIRVKKVDAIEHITDFGSATDHTWSLKKFQELNLPMTIPVAKQQQAAYSKVPYKSVFEEDADFTAMDDAQARSVAKDKRWRFSGPWLSGMGVGAFRKWVETRIRARRPEFLQWLKIKIAEDRNELVRAKALDAGEQVDESLFVTREDITDSELTEYVRRVRYDRPKLFEFVSEFLDLAPIRPDENVDLFGAIRGRWKQQQQQIGGGNPWGREGPPMTHPSAGISYLRTDSFLHNHPIYGPQKLHPPVEARWVQPSSQSGAGLAKLGIAGFVATMPEQMSAIGGPAGRGRSFNHFDPDAEGGAKSWVKLTKAQVDSNGRIVISMNDAETEAKLVAQEMKGDAEVFHARDNPYEDEDDFLMPRPKRKSERRSSNILSSAETYGLPGLSF
jgi:hypothetical protein